jgi:aryl-alcohol dehydrogenase-like predicted oxidoreductase
MLIRGGINNEISCWSPVSMGNLTTETLRPKHRERREEKTIFRFKVKGFEQSRKFLSISLKEEKD